MAEQFSAELGRRPLLKTKTEILMALTHKLLMCFHACKLNLSPRSRKIHRSSQEEEDERREREKEVREGA